MASRPTLDAEAHIRAATDDPAMVAAARALGENRLDVAEAILRARLKVQPDEVAAIRMLAETAGRLGRYGDAEVLLRRALDLAPGFDAARHNLALVLHRQGRMAEAKVEIEALLARHPQAPGYRVLHAAILALTGEYDKAIVVYETVLADHPEQARTWMSYGHTLKTVGQQADCIAAYRRAIAGQPTLGEAWWSLANLKTASFDDGDLGAMRAALADPALTVEDRYHLDFALGKALEDRADYAASFGHYAKANALRRAQLSYDAAETTAAVAATKALFTAEFLAARAGAGSQARDPIFVVGLPRAGSTLIEQILSSHSTVEGTSELPDIGALARRVAGESGGLDAAALAALGEEYLQRTRVHRRTGRSRFVDKMPNNFLNIGLIHLILPNARIIDARRHPLATCFSAYKQHFARGQAFTYDLGDVGAYWRDYAGLMAHFDAVLPGRVHRVDYEAMVADPEAEIRALLDYCGLEFEPACLSFHQTDRAVRTPSSEQVRQPLYATAVEHWRHYEPWLAPLKQALGDVV